MPAVLAATGMQFLSTPSARRATSGSVMTSLSGRFLSTPSARRATLDLVTIGADDDISIHALREEGDRMHASSPCSRSYFYPRPPRGGRLSSASFAATFCLFLSTPSARRATNILEVEVESSNISIHALREEGDTRAHARRSTS